MRGGYTQGFWDLTIIVCVCATFVAMDGDGWQDYLTSSTTGPLWKLGMGFMQSVTASGIWAQTTQSCILIWNTILNGKFKVSLPFPVEERSIAWIKQPDSSSGGSMPNYINKFENKFLTNLVQMFEKKHGTLYFKDQFSLLTGCLLACIILAYWLFIKAHIIVSFCMTIF